MSVKHHVLKNFYANFAETLCEDVKLTLQG